jgi:hypothetical protein
VAVAVYDDFSAGEAGRFGLTKPPAQGFWSGKNVMVYPDGLLGPRPGMKDLTLAGVPQGRIIGAVPQANQGSSAGTEVWVACHQNDGTPAVKLYRFNPTTGAVAVSTLEAATSSSPGLATMDTKGDKVYYREGGKSYRYDAAPEALDLLRSGDIGGPTFTIHGVRAYSGNAHKVVYSAANDFTSWPSTNFFEVGEANEYVEALVSVGDVLFIIKRSGAWVLTGSPTGGRLSRVGDLWGVEASWLAKVTRESTVVVYDLPARQPGVWDGAKYQLIPHIVAARGGKESLFAPANRGLAIAGSHTGHASLFLDDKRAYTGEANTLLTLFDGKTWSQHHTTLDVSGSIAAWPGGDKRFVVPIEPAVNMATVRWLAFDPFLGRPGFTTDTYARPGDDSDTPLAANVSLPEFWTEAGNEVSVRQVIVDAVKWNTGSATANEIQVSVETFGRRGTAGEKVDTKTWTEAGTAASTSGTRHREVFDFGRFQPGAGFQVKFPSLRGVAIRSVTVVYDETARPRR